MIKEAQITAAVGIVRRAAPGARVIVFGSHARGDAREDSDLDLLVIEPEVTARRAEMVRLREALRPLGIPVDVQVASQRTFERWANTPGTLLHDAAREGRVFDASS